jgi:hypothetical protein
VEPRGRHPALSPARSATARTGTAGLPG